MPRSVMRIENEQFHIGDARSLRKISPLLKGIILTFEDMPISTQAVIAYILQMRNEDIPIR